MLARQSEVYETAAVSLFNAVSFSGMYGAKGNIECAEAYVVNSRTGVGHRGFLESQKDGTLAGFLTTGGFDDARGQYKIEIGIYGRDGSFRTASGRLIGSVINETDYPKMIFITR